MAAAGELQESTVSSVHQQSTQTHAGSGKAGHRNGAEQQAAIRERLIRQDCVARCRIPRLCSCGRACLPNKLRLASIGPVLRHPDQPFLLAENFPLRKLCMRIVKSSPRMETCCASVTCASSSGMRSAEHQDSSILKRLLSLACMHSILCTWQSCTRQSGTQQSLVALHPALQRDSLSGAHNS